MVSREQMQELEKMEAVHAVLLHHTRRRLLFSDEHLIEKDIKKILLDTQETQKNLLEGKNIYSTAELNTFIVTPVIKRIKEIEHQVEQELITNDELLKKLEPILRQNKIWENLSTTFKNNKQQIQKDLKELSTIRKDLNELIEKLNTAGARVVTGETVIGVFKGITPVPQAIRRETEIVLKHLVRRMEFLEENIKKYQITWLRTLIYILSKLTFGHIKSADDKVSEIKGIQTKINNFVEQAKKKLDDLEKREARDLPEETGHLKEAAELATNMREAEEHAKARPDV
jgi:hypothetical protein